MHYLSFFKTWLGIQAILALLYLPWLLRVWTTLADYGGNGESPRWLEMAWRSLSVFAVGKSLPDDQRLLWSIFPIAVILLGTLWRLFNLRYSHTILLCYLWIPLIIIWFSATSRPIFDERYLIGAAPPFYLLLAATLTALWKWKGKLVSGLSVFLTCAILSGSILSLYNHYYDTSYSKTRGWRELAARMDALSATLPPERVRLVQNYPDPTLWYYYHGSVPHLVLPPVANDVRATEQEVNTLIEADVERVVLAAQFSPSWDADGIAAQILSQQYQPVGTLEIGSWQVITWLRPPNVWTDGGVIFENGMVLEHWHLAPTRIVPGGLLAVHLVWRLDAATLSGNEKVFIHLVDDSGTLVAQNDQLLGQIDGQVDGQVDGEATELVKAYGIQIPVGLEVEQVAEYRLLVGLYDPSMAGAPRIMTVDGVDSVSIDADITAD